MIGGLASSTILTLVVVPVVCALMNESPPGPLRRVTGRGRADSRTTLSST